MKQLVLLSKRDVIDAAIQSIPGELIKEKIDAPTSKHVAVVWVQSDGLAPEAQGLLNVKQIIYN